MKLFIENEKKLFFLLLVIGFLISNTQCFLESISNTNKVNAKNTNLNTLVSANTERTTNSNLNSNSNSITLTNSNLLTNTNKISTSNSNTLTATNKSTAANTVKSEVKDKLSLNGKIFVSESFLKQKKENTDKEHKKQIDNTITPTAISPDNEMLRLNDDLAKNTNLMNLAGIKTESAELSKGPIYLQGWVKYFKYQDVDAMTETPKHFYRNNEFFNQVKIFPQADLNSKEQGMLTYIKDPSYFFAVLFSNSLNFVTSRQIPLQKTYDSINIDYIAPVMENPGYTAGGILDFGNYNEGFCFKVVVKRPNKNWVICTEALDEKTNFMSMLKKLKLKGQREMGIIADPAYNSNNKETLSKVLHPDSDVSSSSISTTPLLNKDKDGNMKVKIDSNAKLIDGYWIIMQDWTQCSLKCGGGTSTLQRMCVPPKNGGASCLGSDILTKACNSHLCPNILNLNHNTTNSTTSMLKPVVKVMPFSSRPQRYTKCIIKESDLLMTQKTDHISNNNNNNNNNIINNMLLDRSPSNNIQEERNQVPTRVVMNNRTITIFSGEDYNTLVMVFNLIETNFIKSTKHLNCFFLSENQNKQAELCPFGCDSVVKELEQWDYDFNLFKYKCNTNRDIIDVDQEKLNKRFEAKVKNAKREMLEEREKEIKIKLEQKEVNELEGVVKSTNKVALQAIQKEINLEDMIKREEAEKEAEAEKEILENIEEEKKKSDCIIKSIKERKIENQFNDKAKLAEDQISNIKINAAEQVTIKRNQLKNTIMEMRKKAQKRQRTLQNQLHTVRLTVADEMGRAYKKGDKSKCEQGGKDEEKRFNYCDANFVDNFFSLQNCKDKEEFINSCCENEFGDFYESDRMDCKKFGEVSKVTNDNGEELGQWKWHNLDK